MNTLARSLPPITLASALLAIAGSTSVFDVPLLAFVFKPLTTVLIVLHAWPRGGDAPTVRRLVLAGLVCSLAGDVALMWPKQGFVPGLVAFLLAHLLYIAAFTRGHRFAARPAPLVVYALIAATILAFLWSGVPPGLRVPVTGYVLALTAMAAQAAVVGGATLREDGARARGLILGGALFMASDALLATNRFALPLPLASVWILATYWSAQWLIASWLRPGPSTASQDRASSRGIASAR